jgi:hypothetical protein
VFPVRYEMSSYILIGRNSVLKGLKQTTAFYIHSLMLPIILFVIIIPFDAINQSPEQVDQLYRYCTASNCTPIS